MCLNGGIEMNQPECMCDIIKNLYLVCYPQHCPALSYLPPCKLHELQTNWYCDTKSKCGIPFSNNNQPSYQPRCPEPPPYNFTANPKAASECETFDNAINTCIADSNITSNLQKCVEATYLSVLSPECRNGGLDSNLPECMCILISKVYMTCYPTHCTTLSYLSMCPKYTYESNWYCNADNTCSITPRYSNL
jgi:hypothetical protein